jgi:hypothetical protein
VFRLIDAIWVNYPATCCKTLAGVGPELCKSVHSNFRESDFPDVGRLCVMVPKKTEYWLRFSARLADGALGVRFELMARG